METVSLRIREIVEKMLIDLGIDISQLAPGSTQNVVDHTAYLVERVNSRWLVTLGADSIETEFLKVDGWCSNPSTLRNMLSQPDGQKYNIGQLVWVHDRHERKHRIIAKAGILTFEEPEYLLKVEDQYFVYSGSLVCYYSTEGANFNGAKLWCLEPVEENDKGKTAMEMQNERDEVETRCRVAESTGALTLRQVCRKFTEVKTRMGLIGTDGDSARRESELRLQIITQVRTDEGVATSELKPWVVVSDAVLALYVQYCAFTRTSE